MHSITEAPGDHGSSEHSVTRRSTRLAPAVAVARLAFTDAFRPRGRPRPFCEFPSVGFPKTVPATFEAGAARLGGWWNHRRTITGASRRVHLPAWSLSRRCWSCTRLALSVAEASRCETERDLWLRAALDFGGLGRVLAPMVICGTLFGWHYLRRERWRVRPAVCTGMLLESLALGLLLLLVASWHASWTRRPPLAVDGGGLSQAFAYLGAGVYEEMLFRLLLLPGVIALLRAAGGKQRDALVWSVIMTSVLFAAAHHGWRLENRRRTWRLGGGEPWDASVFLFRVGAGFFFCVVFLQRGFGVVVGAHAAYDLLIWCREHALV